MNLSDQDLKTIEEKGLSLSQVNKQIQTFKSGLPFTHLMEAATIGNGILMKLKMSGGWALRLISGAGRSGMRS